MQVEPLRDRIEKEEQSAELINLRHNIAIHAVRISDILENLDQSPGLDLFLKLEVEIKNLDHAIYEADGRKVAAATEALRKLIGEGARTASAWRELQRNIEQHRRLVTSERDAMIKARTLLKISEVQHAMNTFVSIVLEYRDACPEMAEKIRVQYALMMGIDFAGKGNVEEQPKMATFRRKIAKKEPGE